MKRGVIAFGAVLVVAAAAYLLWNDRAGDESGFGAGEETAGRVAELLEGEAPEGVALHVLGKEPPPPSVDPLPEPIPMAERTGTLTIDVRGPGGSAVESAAVWVVAKARKGNNLLRAVWLPSRTQVSVPPEVLSVLVRRADMAMPEPVDVDARSGSASLQVQLKEPTILHGKVTGPSGLRLHTAKVLVLSLEGRPIPEWRQVADEPTAKQVPIGRTEPVYSIKLVPGRYMLAFTYGAEVYVQGLVDMDDQVVARDIVAPPLPEGFVLLTINGVTVAQRNRLTFSVRVVRDEVSFSANPIVVPTWDGAFRFRVREPQPNDSEHVVEVSLPGRGRGASPYVLGRSVVIDLTLNGQPERVKFGLTFDGRERWPTGERMSVQVSRGSERASEVYRAGAPEGIWMFSSYTGKHVVKLTIHRNRGTGYVGNIEAMRFEITVALEPAAPIPLAIPTLYEVVLEGGASDEYASLLREVSPTEEVWRHQTVKTTAGESTRLIAVPPGDYKVQQGRNEVSFTVPDQLTVRLPSR